MSIKSIYTAHGTAVGGRGDLVGSYSNTASVIVSVYGNWTF